MNNLLLIGGGGHCKVIIDSLSYINCYDKMSIIDVPERIGTSTLNIPVIGSDDNIEDLFNKGYTNAFISIGTIGSTDVKVRLYDNIKNIGFNIPNIIDVTGIVSRYADLGKGIYVGKKAVVNPNAKIGNGVIINTNAVVEHDCEIGDFCHIAPGAIVCGNVRIGKNTHIGAGSVIKQGVHIGENVMIGIGSVVTKNIDSNITAYGNPCREKI